MTGIKGRFTNNVIKNGGGGGSLQKVTKRCQRGVGLSDKGDVICDRNVHHDFGRFTEHEN